VSERTSKWLRRGRKLVIVLAPLYLIGGTFMFVMMHQRPRAMSRVFDKIPMASWMVFPAESMWRWANRGTLEPGDLAPDFDLATVDGQSRVRLSSLRGKPVVLFFGSYTCPPFRRIMPDMNGLYAPYKDRAHFYFIYIEEAHTSDAWQMKSNERDGVVYPQARTLQERVKVGSTCAGALKIPFPMLVDEMDDRTEHAYRAWPTRVYVVDKDGRIAFKSGPGPFGFIVEEVKPGLERALGKPAPAPEPAKAPSA
jgi:thiol-disulfide isomerase/thioredoxin